MSVIRQLLFFVFMPYAVCNDLCLNCPASQVGCGTIVKCGIHEACYKDTIVQPDGIIEHEMGCRDILKCQLSNSSLLMGRDVVNSNPDPKRTIQSTVMCSQCCHGNLCNNDLCGHRVFPENSGPICYACDTQLKANSCSKVTQCSRDQDCQIKPKMFSSDQYVYETKCSPKTICQAEVNTATHSYPGCHGRCCNSTLCNTFPQLHGPCQPRITTTHGTSPLVTHTTPQVVQPCASSPCMHGICYDTATKYMCVCDSNYTGMNCDTAITTCSSNPCVHGTCYSGPSDYICSCNMGFQGKNCDQSPLVTHTTPQVVQPCASLPCMHGICYDTATKYMCVCDSNYTGMNCDTAITTCSSNPCVHGTCNSGPSDYICSCNTGFQGKNCDQSTTTTPHPKTTHPHSPTVHATTTAPHVSKACPDGTLFCCDFETECKMQSGHHNGETFVTNDLWNTTTNGTDHTFGINGHYAKLDSGTADLVSPPVNVHGEFCVHFAYKICATNHSELRVGIYQTEEHGHHITECVVDGHGEHAIISDNQWHNYAYTVKGHHEDAIKLFFRGLVNTGQCSSVAIDDIKVTSGKCACAEHHGPCEHQEAHCEGPHHPH